ncbi:unnamed protein product [Lota lota]
MLSVTAWGLQRCVLVPLDLVLTGLIIHLSFQQLPAAGISAPANQMARRGSVSMQPSSSRPWWVSGSALVLPSPLAQCLLNKNRTPDTGGGVGYI